MLAELHLIRKRQKKTKKNYQSQVSILGPVGYGPTTLPLRHSDVYVQLADVLYMLLFGKG
jgi:hypothetical protein